MDKTLIRDLFNALKFEAIRFRVLYVLLFVVVAFVPLAVGYYWPNSYSTEALLHAEESNIIEPLLRGRAQITNVDRAAEAREVIYSRRVLERAAESAGLVSARASDDEKAQAVRHIRSRVRVATEGRQHFRVSYSSDDPDQSFLVLNSVVNVFIQDSARRKREESMGAFNFIDAQADSYRRQLERAEQRLKEFRSQNTDGTEAQVSARINQLRNDIENLGVEIEESESRLLSIQQQLSQESEYQMARGQADTLRERRRDLNRQLEQLRMSYQDSYPDIVSVRQQIQDLDNEIANLDAAGDTYSSGERIENPLYEELRLQMSIAEVEKRTRERRLDSLQRMLEREHERAERVAANQAELSDLTRDLNVTRDVYEEMLQRRESARLSMTLDVEGQGVSYRIQDPATFPLGPSGLRYVHFAAIGPFVGFLAPLGLLIIYIMLDPHLRSARNLQLSLPEGVEVIGAIPHYHTPLTRRILRKDIILLFILSVLAMAGYAGLGYTLYEIKS
ncbi:XrtA system polysaccharide chain length determinant [Marinimicrobium alkaliphilum]|uniref:XrtA system polysaccharide chain length determinant n=1 Tax=Marinimicrobium alkaliphilum TaxID=2202654 RepID=UPI000DBAC39B|nr:XrtA system polysaccharide chain length determinant [Marinimicrobium alkaliphilum]